MPTAKPASNVVRFETIGTLYQGVRTSHVLSSGEDFIHAKLPRYITGQDIYSHAKTTQTLDLADVSPAKLHEILIIGMRHLAHANVQATEAEPGKKLTAGVDFVLNYMLPKRKRKASPSA